MDLLETAAVHRYLPNLADFIDHQAIWNSLRLSKMALTSREGDKHMALYVSKIGSQTPEKVGLS